MYLTVCSVWFSCWNPAFPGTLICPVSFCVTIKALVISCCFFASVILQRCINVTGCASWWGSRCFSWTCWARATKTINRILVGIILVLVIRVVPVILSPLSLRFNFALYSAWRSFVASSVLSVSGSSTYSATTSHPYLSAIRIILLRSLRAFSHWSRFFSAAAIDFCSKKTLAFDTSSIRELLNSYCLAFLSNLNLGVVTEDFCFSQCCKPIVDFFKQFFLMLR